MRIKGVAILCHVIITPWRTAWKKRPFSPFVFLWVHSPDMPLASTLLFFVTLPWCRGVGCGMGRNCITWLRPCPRISIVIHFKSTPNPPPDVDWMNARSMRIELLRIQWTCMWTRTKRIHCALEVPCEWALIQMYCHGYAPNCEVRVQYMCLIYWQAHLKCYLGTAVTYVVLRSWQSPQKEWLLCVGGYCTRLQFWVICRSERLNNEKQWCLQPQPRC